MNITAFAEENIPGFTIKKDFEQEYSGSCKPGDVIILRNDSKIKLKFWEGPTYHAGVCCEDDEVIHLSDIQGGLIRAGTGNICRQQVTGFTHGKPFRILEKVDGIPPSFNKDVKQAMNSDKRHDRSKHNCIDFSLELIGINPEDHHKLCLANSAEHQLPDSSAPSAGDREESTSDQEPVSSQTKDGNEGSSENDDKTPLVPPPPVKVAESQSPGEQKPEPVLPVEED